MNLIVKNVNILNWTPKCKSNQIQENLVPNRKKAPNKLPFSQTVQFKKLVDISRGKETIFFH